MSSVIDVFSLTILLSLDAYVITSLLIYIFYWKLVMIQLHVLFQVLLEMLSFVTIMEQVTNSRLAKTKRQRGRPRKTPKWLWTKT